MINIEQLNYYYNFETKKIKNTLRYMSSRDPELYKQINNYIDDIELTKPGNIKQKFVIKFYCYINQIPLPKCKHQDCNNDTTYQKGKFDDFCSIKCCNTSEHKNIKIKSTWDNKSPEDHQIKIDKFKQSYKNNFENFKDNIMTSKKITNLSNWNDKEFIEDNFLDDMRQFKLFAFMDYFNCCQPKAHNKLEELNIDYNKINKMYSQAEKEVVQFIKDLNDSKQSNLIIKENVMINKKEFDIIVEDTDGKILLGVEYNGLYWHSYRKDTHRPKSYYRTKHLEKTLIAEENNFQLLHIFENEWAHPQKRLIWEDIIKAKLNLLDKKIPARKCKVRYVRSQDATEFISCNHIQGKNNRGNIRLGLYYNDELVYLSTFGAPQFVKEYNKNDYEIIRMCAKLDCNVIGASSKILKYFIKMYNPNTIISYANRRWSLGNVYNKIGFKLSDTLEPNHYYFKNNTMFHRRKFQVKNVKNMLKENYNNSISGIDNVVQQLDMHVIWDSGNYKYLMKC